MCFCSSYEKGKCPCSRSRASVPAREHSVYATITLDQQIEQLEGELESLRAQRRAKIRLERVKANALKKLTKEEKDALGV